jgi:hypothetical protein
MTPDPRLLWLDFKLCRNAVKEVGDLNRPPITPRAQRI